MVTISTLLKRFINHEFASVVLYNEELQELRVHALDVPSPGDVLSEGSLLPMKGTPPGLAIRTRKTVRREAIDLNEFDSPEMRNAYDAGVRSGCSVPLISHNRILGTINVGSLRVGAISSDDQELLEQISVQVAIAVENALNFERAEREAKRSRLLLEINNAVTSHLDLEQLVKAISGTLRDVIQHDAAGIASGMLCVLSGIGIGTIIATFTRSQQQAQLLGFFVTPPLSMLSGATTPIEAIPHWLQPITYLNPVRHFATLARGVMLKGVGIEVVYPNLLTLIRSRSC